MFKLKFDGHAVVVEGFIAQLLKMKLELDVAMSWKISIFYQLSVQLLDNKLLLQKKDLL